ncbi:MAG: zinc metalloprotease HtpX [Candidatus Thiodiazotropha lotti]|uniref:Peptidase M48 domain-containing protein n=1 Tax=Candidatus Thiodiazotropha endoloripes TaxID=1818881 RepID=A0A1E2UUB5_9GAMM|nr:zinc metalloprotease HtpX [Candidatus Thiodiazotropha endoloripes]MCG7898198.1 zinc metalloprotease HtpX [Candidatus Thiodiazotropha weberae]MCG7993245.1 zinc metalloprotease HtpX [Candidatus Thiodiazotropha lotti]MCG7904021.1 zinc metalloprotease HtpX [Candidatus Thiodiazotropha weberae]MCG7915353.1 zinc metalloprotease HtpX [Candidatus Thiodiazotropha weberae]MCG8001410.1 zinc metalloprotease HtpX [Candidatus Thiodiazotropha lotti]
MNFTRISQHKFRNFLQTLLLLGGMSLLLALCVELLFGQELWLWVFIGTTVIIFALPDMSPRWLLHLYQARPISPDQAPQLWMVIEELSRRAKLKSIPTLYWIPSKTTNAFSVGRTNQTAIALTDGLLELLSMRELIAVLAHETAHLANNDIRLMNIADLISRLTHLMSSLGIILLLITFPLLFLGYTPFSLWGILLLIVSPSLSAVMQLGLSRIREFDADLLAAELTGDPAGLANALNKIAYPHGRFWQKLLLPGYRRPEPSLLRTHPEPGERIDRLLELGDRSDSYTTPMEDLPDQSVELPTSYTTRLSPGHRTIFRIWR